MKSLLQRARDYAERTWTPYDDKVISCKLVLEKTAEAWLEGANEMYEQMRKEMDAERIWNAAQDERRSPNERK